jgi:hypothetical protein
MGGAISVESTFGRGSRFTIQVPAYIEDSHRDDASKDAQLFPPPQNGLSHAIG